MLGDQTTTWEKPSLQQRSDNMHKNGSTRVRGYHFPTEELRIKDSEVLRSNSSKQWKNRRLVLTKDDLLEGLSGQEKITEKIPLVSIKNHIPNFRLSEPLDSAARSMKSAVSRRCQTRIFPFQLLLWRSIAIRKIRQEQPRLSR